MLFMFEHKPRAFRISTNHNIIKIIASFYKTDREGLHLIKSTNNRDYTVASFSHWDYIIEEQYLTK